MSNTKGLDDRLRDVPLCPSGYILAQAAAGAPVGKDFTVTAILISRQTKQGRILMGGRYLYMYIFNNKGAELDHLCAFNALHERSYLMLLY